MVSTEWDFISTYAEVENNRIKLLTRDLERALQFCTTTTKTINPIELANYTVEEILGVRYLIEGNIIKGLCTDPFFEALGAYLLKLSDGLLSNSTSALVRKLHLKMYTTDDFYKQLLMGEQFQNESYSIEYLLGKYPALYEDLALVLADDSDFFKIY